MPRHSRPGTSSGDSEAGGGDALSENHKSLGEVLELAMEAAAKRLKQQQLRVLLLTEPTVAPTEMDSMFLLEINQMYYLH
ncbi:hypothetical protein PF007_g28923 [Phytophthora fragariae]|uniref:Uncharacterized protein n=1 Tax=Phytophthora fragariae TaxID=53985 RepID=A0A6A3PYK7_9STRA|nr:hypothetical protein PF007_g28923 [Phytophthora fragariae]KAE9187414.1 hypothetical protein PF004_g22802 [Phytophthora fragariae]